MDVEFSPFVATAKLLYESAFIAERYSGIRNFLEQDKVPHLNVHGCLHDDYCYKDLGIGSSYLWKDCHREVLSILQHASVHCPLIVVQHTIGSTCTFACNVHVCYGSVCKACINMHTRAQCPCNTLHCVSMSLSTSLHACCGPPCSHMSVFSRTRSPAWTELGTLSLKFG